VDIRNLKLQLKKENHKLVYVVSGDDLYLKSAAEAMIKNHFALKEAEVDLETYTASNMDTEKCLDSLQTLSFFSSTKIVHIRDFDKANAKFAEDLSAFVQEGNLSGLVILLSCAKFDKRKKSLKAILDKAELVEVKTPYDNQVEQWVKYIAAEEGLKLEAGAAAFLNFLVGPSLVEVSKSVSKLKDVFGKEKIGRLQIQELISKTGEQDVFKICDMLGKGQITEAVLSVEYSLKHGSNAIAVLNLFYRHFKILNGILEAAASGKRIGQKELAAKVGIPPYFLANYTSQSRTWTRKKLAEVFYAIEAADVSLKSTKMKESTVFSGFFVEVSRILGEKKGLRSLTASLF